jgi:hypothetical protein
MLTDLTTCAPATRRLILLAYALQHPAQYPAVVQRLLEGAWVPTPEDCPVAWEAVEAWYQGIQRTATQDAAKG